VLIRVYAASLNVPDHVLMRGMPYIARLYSGLRRPGHGVRGLDVAGTVAEVGPNVTDLRPGDNVFGSCEPYVGGGFAEYARVPRDRVVPKPPTITFEQAAAVPVAAVTALQALRDAAQLQPGRQVLIVGASGGVGTFAVQIAKALGAQVTGVCSTRNLDLVRSIGADAVIDYTRRISPGKPEGSTSSSTTPPAFPCRAVSVRSGRRESSCRTRTRPAACSADWVGSSRRG